MSEVHPATITASPSTTNAATWETGSVDSIHEIIANYTRRLYTHKPSVTKVVILGKGGFSSSPTVAYTSLKELGYRVEMIQETDDNLMKHLKSIAQSEEINLVVCNFAQTGKSSGLTILEKIKKLLPTTPVVMLTYKEGSEITAKLLEAGAADIISPPVSPEIVTNRLRNVLETFYVRRELESVKGTIEAHQKLTEEVSELKSYLEQAKVEIVSRENLLSEKEKEIENQKEGMSALQTLLTQTQHELNRIKGMESEYTANIQQKEDEATDKEHLSLQLEIKDNAIKDLKAAYATLSEEKDKLSIEYANLVASSAAEAAKYETMNKTIEAFQSEKDHLHNQIERLHKENTEKDRINFTLLQELEKSRDHTSKLEEEITGLKRKLDLLTYRMSLLTCELTKQLVLKSDVIDKEDREIIEKSQRVQQSFYSPAEAITAELTRLADGEQPYEEIKQALGNIIKAVQNSNNMHKPSFDRIFENVSLDFMTKAWMEVELGDPSKQRKIPTNASTEFPSRFVENITYLQPVPSQSEVSPPIENEVTEKMLEIARQDEDKRKSELNDFGFDIFFHSEEMFIPFIIVMFKDLGLIQTFSLSEVALLEFVSSVRGHYRTNPYHNFRHAFDVTQTCYVYLKKGIVGRQLVSQLDIFALMVSALCHDIQHPGLTNSFQCSARTKLSLTYNDISVLENMHASVTFHLLLGPNNDVKSGLLAALTPEQFKEFRKLTISSILYTDMALHFELLSKWNTHQSTKGTFTNSIEDRQLLLGFLLHAADISNVSKPINVRKWSDLVFQEFLSQGDKEKELGLPVSPYYDRNNTDQVKLSLNFIDFMVGPLFVSLAKTFNEFDCCNACVKLSREYWAGFSKEEPQIPKPTEKEIQELQKKKKQEKSPRPPPPPELTSRKKEQLPPPLKIAARPVTVQFHSIQLGASIHTGKTPNWDKKITRAPSQTRLNSISGPVKTLPQINKGTSQVV